MHIVLAFAVVLGAAGPHPVGYELHALGARRVPVWYPAARPGAALTYRAYADDPAALRRLVANLAVDADGNPSPAPPPDVEKLLAAPVLATRGAPRAAGRFPLVVLGSDSFDLLGEHMASKGFLVVGLPRGRVPQTSAADVERQADVVLEVLAAARTLPGAGER